MISKDEKARMKVIKKEYLKNYCGHIDDTNTTIREICYFQSNIPMAFNRHRGCHFFGVDSVFYADEKVCIYDNQLKPRSLLSQLYLIPTCGGFSHNHLMSTEVHPERNF